MTCERELTPAATYCTPGSARIASASAGTSVFDMPWP
jgi:hypothetical protein